MTGTLLVTGATGFIGRHLVPTALRAGWRVRAAARNPAVIAGQQTVAMPDLSRGEIDWAPLLEGVTHVVHLAGLAHMKTRIPEPVYDAVNAGAVASLAAAAKAARVRRLVLVSSIRAQIGPVWDRIVRETDEPAPTDPYGRSKLAGERAMLSVLSDAGTESVILRPVLVYGPGVKGNMAMLLKLARLPVPLPLAGLSNRRSIVSVANVCSAILHASVSPAVAGRVFLVADAEAVSVPQIITAMRSGLGRPPGLLRVPLSPVEGLLKVVGRAEVWARLAGDLVADTSRLTATGWVPPEDTATALSAMTRRNAAA